jgi:thiamine biosynthesis lipoprotein
MRTPFRLSLLLSFLSILFSCSARLDEAPVYEQEKVLMGTVFKIKAASRGIPEEKVEAAFTNAFHRIASLESQMSEWIAESPVSEAARQSGLTPVPVTMDLANVTELGLAISDSTGGVFDPTFLPLGRLWDIKHRKSPPPPDSIAAALKLVDYRDVRLEREKMTLYLEKKGMKIGFGGIAKGYAAREAGRILERAGIEDYIINAGGDLFVHGRKDGGEWSSGIQDPDRKDAPPLIRFKIKRECGIATSGGYENFFIWNGRRYHHIIDLSTGQPASGMKSATVFAHDPAKADAYATAFFILGPELSRARTMRDTTLAYILIDSTGRVHRSPNLSAFIEE